MLQAAISKNDKKAQWLIGIFSVIVFAAVTVLGKYNLARKVHLGFDVHIFAMLNASINGLVAVLLLVGLYFAKQKNFNAHKQVMMTAMILSIFFLLSYNANQVINYGLG